KKEARIEILEYLVTKFQYDYLYGEKEVNSIIMKWHTFEDYFLLRRSLIDYKFLSRKRDGSEYWRNKHE
ncbi:MAG TPA: transcriptional regulator, partial [Clostridium sp.]|nr:transcriptional regulator [Clostridium sp.]